MEFNVTVIRNFLLGIGVGLILGSIYYIIERQNHSQLLKNGKKTEVLVKEGGDFNNYYFLTKKGKVVQITHYLNKKQHKTGRRKYFGKSVFYSEQEPSNFTINEEAVGWKFYFIVIPVFFGIIYLFVISELLKLKKRLTKRGNAPSSSGMNGHSF